MHEELGIDVDSIIVKILPHPFRNQTSAHQPSNSMHQNGYTDFYADSMMQQRRRHHSADRRYADQNGTLKISVSEDQYNRGIDYGDAPLKPYRGDIIYTEPGRTSEL